LKHYEKTLASLDIDVDNIKYLRTFLFETNPKDTLLDILNLDKKGFVNMLSQLIRYKYENPI
jgi:hypothetical protein